MSHDLLLIARAWHFAAERHAKQKRKGSGEEPYVNHLAEVAELVAYATDGEDANLVAAAVLHDAIEDTKTSRAELETLFNEDVAGLVAEVTDDKGLPKQRRKTLQVEKAASKSKRARILKLADKTSNLRSLAKSPPADWSEKRRKEYLVWANQVVDEMRGTNEWLEARFDEAAATVGRVLRADQSGRQRRS
jgi:GTP diphosphokinase / guanosine-3',5'-bis(diphosphate) 3'-diphosphatase